MKKLNRIFIYYVIKYFLVLALIFLPILYLSDFFFSEQFDVLYSIAKLPIRYGQSIANLLVWGAWLGAKNLKRRYGEETFIVLGFRIKDSWPAIIFLSALFMFIDLGCIIPASSLCPEEVIRTNWCLNKIDKRNFFIYRSPVNKMNTKNADGLVEAFEHVGEAKVFHHQRAKRKKAKELNSNDKYRHIQGLYSDVFEVFWNDGDSVNFEECISHNCANNTEKIYIQNAGKEFEIHDRDFYSIWNEPKKLSWSGLKRYKKYLQYHNLSYDDITIQYHAFFSRAVLLIGMILCGLAFGWEVGLSKILFCAIASCWLSQIAFFFPFLWALTLLWFNSFIWIGVGLWYLL
ncbi:MAG: hypothetical protein WC755_07175 [Candidatus Woesearchaeota archaeon]|jgi:hypothetical protein